MGTIKSSKEIDLIFKNGKKINLPFLVIILFNDKENLIKGNIAFIAGKKNGNAVWRNKSKRKLREIYKELKINKECKMLLVAKKGIEKENLNEMIEICNKKLKEQK